MKATLTNDLIVISDPTQEMEECLSKLLSYTDKAKAYQVKRMSRNPFSRNSALYKKLQSEIKGSLMQKGPTGQLLIPPGFSTVLKNIEIDDQRSLTGAKVSFPWVNKPKQLRDYQSEAVI